jgi:uncharacterized membrane protein YccF (DUF307 family)
MSRGKIKMNFMRTLGNILWHIPFLGFLTAFGTFIVGGLFVITIIGAPIGLGLIQLSKFLLTPFSSAMVSKKDLNAMQNKYWQTFSLIVRILYFPFGLILATAAIFQIAALFITIVGIPVALVLAKSLGTFFNPVNKTCVPRAIKDEMERRKATAQIDQHLG